MGSQFVSLHLADPALIQARLRGDFPDVAVSIYQGSDPPSEELRPAFEVMGRGTFVFLPKGATHPAGLLYCRAVEHLLRTLGRRTWSVELYPDEGEHALWELSFGRCEASWLDLPQSDTGIAVTAWKSPATCRSLAGSIRHALGAGSFNPRYSPEETLRECAAALDEGSSSGYGLFTIYQG